MFLKNAITIQLIMLVPLEFCASSKNVIMYASSRMWPIAGILEGVIHSYGQNYPCSFPISRFTDVRDPHVRVFFNLSPGGGEREREGARGQPATGELQSRPRAGCAGCGIPQSRAPVASRPRASSNPGRRRALPTAGSPSRVPAPPVAGSSGQPAAGELQSWPQASSTDPGVP
jgi:hypothetical protein